MLKLTQSLAALALAGLLSVPSMGAICTYTATGFFSDLEFETEVAMINLNATQTAVQAVVEEAGGCSAVSIGVVRELEGDEPFIFDACGATHILEPTHIWGAPAAGLCNGFMWYFAT